MAPLREIKEHIGSVRSIAKVTRAMEMVATARNHRLQTRVESTRTFADKSWEVLNHLAAAAADCVSGNCMFCGYAEVQHIGMLLITSDKGMVGAYNYNILSLVSSYLASRPVPIEFVTLGKVGREAMLQEGRHIHADFSGLGDKVDITDLTPVANVLIEGFQARHFDEILIAYTEFAGGRYIRPRIRQLLPVCPGEATEAREYLYEPNADALLLALLPRLIRFQVFQAFLESLVAENTSRMIAMHSATQNASAMIDDLTLGYNKTRQQTITSEIMDIVGGASALSFQEL